MKDKFKIICLKCGKDTVEIKEDIDYDWDEIPYSNGYHLYCENCGASSDD